MAWTRHCKNCFSCIQPRYRVPLLKVVLHYLGNPPSFSHRFAAPLLICLKRHIYSAKFILPVFMGELTVTKWQHSGWLHANMEETDYTYQPTWMTWVSGSHGRPMKSLQMPREHTLYIRSILLCGAWARVDEISHYTQWTQVHAAVIDPQPTSPHIWSERPCSHDWQRLNPQSAPYRKGWRHFIPMTTGPG